MWEELITASYFPRPQATAMTRVRTFFNLITAVRYYDSAGGLVRTYLEQPIELAPLASRPFVVEERDKAGGGANFIVEWQAGAEVSSPIVEAAMGQVVRPLDMNAGRENRP